MMLSVIIPTCLRDEEQLKRAINSALFNGLDINLINIIVVNDNSSIEISSQSDLLSTYQAYEQVIFTDNHGTARAAGARNFGVSLAKTELITFVDDDDLIIYGRLKLMLEVFKNTKAEDNIVLISTGRFYEYNNFQKLEDFPQRSGLIKLQDIWVNNDIDIGFLLRRQDFLDLKGFDTSFTSLEDWDFIIRLLQEKGNAYKIPNRLYIVKNDIRENRVSNSSIQGLYELNIKHESTFGKKWSCKITTKNNYLDSRLNLIKAFKLSFFYQSIYPIAFFIKRLFT